MKLKDTSQLTGKWMATSALGRGSGMILICALLILALGGNSRAGQIVYTSYRFVTVAGIAGQGGYWDAPVGSAAVFHSPAAVAVETNGSLYVADTFNGVIRKLTPVGTNWSVTTVAAGFDRPGALALDRQGQLYVADAAASTIVRLTPAGTNWVPTILTTNYASTGIAVDAAANVYVNDGYAVIARISPAGTATVLAGLAGATGSTNGSGTAARFNYPAGMALDPATNLYVADSGNDLIRRITPQGTVTTVAGVAGSPGGFDGTNGTASVGLFNDPQGLAVDAGGNVYVADTGNSTIRRITPAGVVTTLGGLLNQTASADGPGVVARFNVPRGIAVAKGVLYVADTANDTIRQGFITAPIILVSGVGNIGNHLGFSLAGLAGQPVVVQATTNFSDWFGLWTNTLTTGTIPFADAQGSTAPRRFYRAAIFP